MSAVKDIIHALRHDIAYEKADIITTRHACGCGRAPTRRGNCHVCLGELLEQLERGVDPEDLQGNRARELWNYYLDWFKKELAK